MQAVCAYQFILLQLIIVIFVYIYCLKRLDLPFFLCIFAFAKDVGSVLSQATDYSEASRDRAIFIGTMGPLQLKIQAK